jgi:hypothetical protein
MAARSARAAADDARGRVSPGRHVGGGLGSWSMGCGKDSPKQASSKVTISPSTNKQTVEVRHVHIHSGGKGVVGIINAPGDGQE